MFYNLTPVSQANLNLVKLIRFVSSGENDFKVISESRIEKFAWIKLSIRARVCHVYVSYSMIQMIYWIEACKV